MKTIHKYEFPVEDEVTVPMRAGAKVLSAGVQRPRHICLWALVESTAPMELRAFSIRGTGHPTGVQTIGKTFIATVFDGEYVWHVFG